MAKYWLFRMVQPNHHCKGKAEEWLISSLVTSCEELTHWKRLWFWEGLGAGGEGDNRGWDGWMASLTRWTWVWVNSRSWWWTGSLACCDSWGRKGSDTTERLNWTELSHPSRRHLWGNEPKLTQTETSTIRGSSYGTKRPYGVYIKGSMRS